MKEEVGILPDVLMNALEKAGLGKFNPKMTRQALLQSAVGMYMAGKLALGQLENVFGKVGDVVESVTNVRGNEVGRTTTTRKRN